MGGHIISAPAHAPAAATSQVKGAIPPAIVVETMAVPPTTSTSQAKEPRALGLNLLPRELVELVVSKVHGKNGVRSTSRILRLAIDACSSELTWLGPSEVVIAMEEEEVGGGAPLLVTLQMALPAAALVALTLLDCSGRSCHRPLGI